MTVIQTKLVQAYATLIMANRITKEQIKDEEVILADGAKSTLIKEVEVEIAKRTVDGLTA